MKNQEEYYEAEFKGKSAAQLMSEIQALKKEIGRLKSIIESNDYDGSFEALPELHAQIRYNRVCLEKAKAALIESGETYIPSEEEKRAEEISRSIPYLSKLLLTIRVYLIGQVTIELTFLDEFIKVKKERLFELQPNEEKIVNYPENKERFMQKFKDLHPEEWQSHYCDEHVLDGTEWSLELYFANEHENIHFGGVNAYPYNIDDFCRLITEAIGEEISAENPFG